jgi:hypothetical protein
LVDGLFLHFLDDVHATQDLAEDDVPAVQMRSRDELCQCQRHGPMAVIQMSSYSDEELRAVGVGAGVRHGQQVRLFVFNYEVFVLEFLAIDGASTGALMDGRVSASS